MKGAGTHGHVVRLNDRAALRSAQKVESLRISSWRVNTPGAFPLLMRVPQPAEGAQYNPRFAASRPSHASRCRRRVEALVGLRLGTIAPK